MPQNFFVKYFIEKNNQFSVVLLFDSCNPFGRNSFHKNDEINEKDQVIHACTQKTPSVGPDLDPTEDRDLPQPTLSAHRRRLVIGEPKNAIRAEPPLSYGNGTCIPKARKDEEGIANRLLHFLYLSRRGERR